MSCNFDCKNCLQRRFKPLSELEPGVNAIILKVNGSGSLRQRLLEMGLTPKTKVELIKTAPLGDPIEISVRGYTLCIRKDEAKEIEVCTY